MRVLVTGATGFVGKKLIAALAEDKHEIVVLSRDSQKAGAELNQKNTSVTVYPWNVAAEVPPLAAFNGVDAVVHLAGEGIANKRWSEKQKKKIYNSRILGTRYLVKSMKELKTPPKVFVCASAIGFYGDRGNEELDEKSAPGTGFLPLVCQDWEAEADGIASTVRTVKLRIGVVLGAEGGMLTKLLPLFKTGLGGPVGNGRQWMSWVHVDDLVRLILHAIHHENVRGVYNGTAPHPATNEEFSKALGKALHRPAVMRAPAFAIKLAMGELSQLVTGSQKVFPLQAKQEGFVYQHERIEGALENIAKKKD